MAEKNENEHEREREQVQVRLSNETEKAIRDAAEAARDAAVAVRSVARTLALKVEGIGTYDSPQAAVARAVRRGFESIICEMARQHREQQRLQRRKQQEDE